MARDDLDRCRKNKMAFEASSWTDAVQSRNSRDHKLKSQEIGRGGVQRNWKRRASSQKMKRIEKAKREAGENSRQQPKERGEQPRRGKSDPCLDTKIRFIFEEGEKK